MAYECCARDRAANCEGDPPRRSRVPDAAMLPPHEYKDDSRTDGSGSTSAPRPASPKFHLCRVAPRLSASIFPMVASPSEPPRKTRLRKDLLDISSKPRAWHRHRRDRAVCDLPAAD